VITTEFALPSNSINDKLQAAPIDALLLQ